MPLPASITTNLFPDFKNSFIGPFARVVQEAQDTDNGSGENIGSNSTNIKKAQSFQSANGGDLSSIDVYLIKVGSPTDNVTIGLYSDNAGEPGTLLAPEKSIPAAAIATGTNKYYRVSFLSPYTLQASTTYWIVLARSDGLDASNHCTWIKNSTAPYANGQMKGFGGTWGALTGDARFKVNIRTTGYYLPCVDKSNNKIRMFKSVDQGNTWSEQDSGDAPAVVSTATLKSISAMAVDNFVSVLIATSATQYAIYRFDTGSDSWATSAFSTSSTVTLNTSIAGVAPLLGAYRNSGLSDYIATYNGATETVMGNARRRIKLKRRAVPSGAWPLAPGYDIVSSPNTPDVTTLPGTAVDYDLRAVVMDGNGAFHAFWTQSDDSNLRHRQYNADDTFAALSNIGSTPAVTSNSAAYSVGVPVSYYRNGEWYIAIPYVDSGVLKVARCLASGAATASNWTITSVVTATIETTNSNPAVLVADNEQGGKLFLIYTKTDGKLYYTHDQANDVWVAEQELHPGTKTVGAISGGVMVDSIGVCYLDTAPATDDLKFDSL